jgi:hypothetical protein
MTMMIVPVQETEQPASSRLVLSRDDAARLKVRSGQRVHLAVTVVPDEETDDMAQLRAAIEEVERGEGIVVSDEDFEAIKREIQDLVDREVEGGTSLTLERLMRKHEAKIEASTSPRG